MAGVVRGSLVRLGLGAAVLLLLLGLATQAPRLLRRFAAFRVERVEVVGTRYLAPHAALEASGITAGSSVFDDPAPWLDALRGHPLVADARAERRLPGTIVLTIVEVEPIALARTPALRPVDAAARALPIDPAVADVDLPVIAARTGIDGDGRLADTAAIALVTALERIRRQAPAIAARISELAPMPGGAIRATLRDPAAAEALLPADLGGLRLEQLRLALADLDARHELPRVRRIDVRFRDQVVVSLSTRSDG